MTIYLDIIFVENILMNYIILFATLVILKAKNKWQQIRLLVSGVIGSVYAIIVYLDILPIYSGIIAKAILSIVMVYVAFNPQSIKQLFKQLLIFYLTSFIFGGCTFALIYFIKPENVQMRNGVFVGMYPIKVAIIGGVIGFIITQIAFKINKNKLNTKNTIFDIQIYYEDKTINIKALLDSGNMLKDPVSEIPVIIIEKEIMYKIIPKNILDYIEKIMKVEVVSDYDYLSDFEWKSATTSWGTPRRNSNIQGRINSTTKKFEKGFGIHANGKITYDLSDKEYDKFEALVGIDSSAIQIGRASCRERV